MENVGSKVLLGLKVYRDIQGPIGPQGLQGEQRIVDRLDLLDPLKPIGLTEAQGENGRDEIGKVLQNTIA